MGREASIAPKERINVTFKPATGGAVEEIELPMKVTVLGDFRQTHDERPLQDRKPVGINKNNFADVMAKQDLRVNISVSRRIQDGDSDVDLPVKLSIQSMRDFEPGNIIHQVPELEQMNRLREALVSLKGPLGNLPTFRRALEDILQDPRQRESIMREVADAGIDITSLLSGDKAEALSADNGKTPAGSENQEPAGPAKKDQK